VSTISKSTSLPRCNGLWLGMTICLATLHGFPAPATGGPHPYYDDFGAVVWRPTLAVAFQEALLTGKPIFLEATSEGQTNCANFARTTFPHPDVKRLLRRYFVCVSLDRLALPAQYDRYIKSKSISTVPVSLFLSPQGEVLHIRQDDPGPADVLPILKKVMSDPRLAMARNKEKEVARQVEALSAALASQDSQKIHAAWGAIQRAPGLCPAKKSACDLMDQAEAEARGKMEEAAKLVRREQYSLARVALEEAEQAGRALPVASEIQQMLATVPLLESAANLEKAKSEPWKQKAVAEYQSVLQKYPDTMLATWTLLKLKGIKKK
jgi:hypothetical protein